MDWMPSSDYTSRKRTKSTTAWRRQHKRRHRSATSIARLAMFKNIVVAIDLNDETSWRKPLLSAVELARTFGAQLYVLTVLARGRSHLGGQGCGARLRSGHHVPGTRTCEPGSAGRSR